MENIQITSPITAERYIRPFVQGLDHEECWAIFLSCGNTVIKSDMLSKGTMNATSIDVRTVLRQALLCNAKSIILLHNHLSGNPSPSQADIRFTDQLRKACCLLDVTLLDHIIITDQSLFSFAEERTITL